MTFPCLFACREEKSLRHVAMVARFLDLIKPWSCKYGREKKRQNWHEWLSCVWLNSCRNKTVAHTFPPFSCVGAARKVSSDWSQKQWYVILSIVLVLFGVRVRRHSDRAAATWPLPLFDNANVRHGQEKLLRSRSLVAMSTWRHTSFYSHICQHFSRDESLRKQPNFCATIVGCFLRLVVMWRNVTCRLYQRRNYVGYRLCCEN